MIGCARSHLRMLGSAGAGHAALNGRASSWTRAAARAARAERRDLRVDRSRRGGEGAHVYPAHRGHEGAVQRSRRRGRPRAWPAAGRAERRNLNTAVTVPDWGAARESTTNSSRGGPATGWCLRADAQGRAEARAGPPRRCGLRPGVPRRPARRRRAARSSSCRQDGSRVTAGPRRTCAPGLPFDCARCASFAKPAAELTGRTTREGSESVQPAEFRKMLVPGIGPHR